jgi:hypothetical protein
MFETLFFFVAVCGVVLGVSGIFKRYIYKTYDPTTGIRFIDRVEIFTLAFPFVALAALFYDVGSTAPNFFALMVGVFEFADLLTGAAIRRYLRVPVPIDEINRLIFQKRVLTTICTLFLFYWAYTTWPF